MNRVDFAAFFIYLMNRLDGLKKELNDKIEMLQKIINHIESKISNIGGQITQMTRPNVIPIREHLDDHPKEN